MQLAGEQAQANKQGKRNECNETACSNHRDPFEFTVKVHGSHLAGKRITLSEKKDIKIRCENRISDGFFLTKSAIYVLQRNVVTLLYILQNWCTRANVCETTIFHVHLFSYNARQVLSKDAQIAEVGVDEKTKKAYARSNDSTNGLG